jgi:type I restriction enzyme, R subunit
VGTCTLISVIAEKIRSLTAPADISDVMEAVEQLLDKSVAAEAYRIAESDDRLVDLSKIDFKKLQAQFAKSRKRTEIEKLRTQIQRKLAVMVQYNRSRVDYLQKFQQMIDEYNAGSVNVEEFFNQLLKFAQDLTEEEKRGISENLTEEELALFDLLTKPDPKLSKAEQAKVKKIVHGLLHNRKTGLRCT